MSNKTTVPRSENRKTKVALREEVLREFVSKYPLRVLDCCAGHQYIWKALQSEFPVESYVALDVRNLPGVTRTDSVRWLRDVGLGTSNVVDIDCYGEPWMHYEVLLCTEWAQDEILCLLTVGLGAGATCGISGNTLRFAGLGKDWESKLPKLSAETVSEIHRACMTACYEHGVEVVQFYEAVPSSNDMVCYALWLKKTSPMT